MKEYRATLTINVFIFADNEDDANAKFEDMDISFIDPDSNDELQSDLIDWELSEVDDGEYQKELDEDDLYKSMKRCED
jgi:hypothetical protein